MMVWIHAHARELLGLAIALAILSLAVSLRRPEKLRRQTGKQPVDAVKRAIYTPKAFRRPRR